MQRKQQHCQFCKKLYSARKGSRFCSDKCRFNAWSRGEDVDRCFYCGIPADTIDHVPPRAYRRFISSNEELAKKYKFEEVPACRECNCALAARALWRLVERKDFIKKYLQKHYKSILESPDWNTSELEELGYSLRTSVEEKLGIKDIIRARISY